MVGLDAPDVGHLVALGVFPHRHTLVPHQLLSALLLKHLACQELVDFPGAFLAPRSLQLAGLAELHAVDGHARPVYSLVERIGIESFCLTACLGLQVEVAAALAFVGAVEDLAVDPLDAGVFEEVFLLEQSARFFRRRAFAARHDLVQFAQLLAKLGHKHQTPWRLTFHNIQMLS